jgi:hypothetical protein
MQSIGSSAMGTGIGAGFRGWTYNGELRLFSVACAATAGSWMSEESQVKSCEHQDNADICEQSFQESVSEKCEI